MSWGRYSRPTAEERGALLEGWGAELLRSYRDYRGLFDEWYCWAPGESHDTEVDFLLRRGNEFVAVEVKTGSNVSAASMRELRAIHGLRGLVRRILLYGGNRRLEMEDGVVVLPVHEFLEWVVTDRLFP